jgi:hypothetical protein
MIKNILGILLVTVLADTCYSQGTNSSIISNTTDVSNTAKVIIMRSTGYAGSATAFTTFIDDNLVCKLNNKRFSIHIVQSGEHSFSVQFAGKQSKEKAERIKINVEPGKTYYVQLIFQSGALINNLYCQEVTENSANLILPRLKEDTKCL